MRRLIAAVLVSVAALGGEASKSNPPPETIWAGKSGGVMITWTTSNITAVRGESRVFSAREWAESGLRHFIAVSHTAATPAPPECDYRRTFRIVAVVGPLVSFEDVTEITCRKEAHPGGMTRLITLDLSSPQPLVEVGQDAIGRIDGSQPGKAVLLTGLFPAGEVLNTLKALPPLQSALKAAGARPQSVPALLEAVGDARGEGENCYVIPPDLLTHFAFDHLQGGQVVIRLGLPGDGLCRMKLTTLDANFPIPASLSSSLQAAATGREGFLAPEGLRIAATRATQITLRSGTRLDHR